VHFQLPQRWFPSRGGILLLAFLFCFAFVGCKKQAPPAPKPPDVQVLTVTPTNVPIYEEWIGTLDGYVNAQIHAQVTGYLTAQKYAEGSRVKKGDVLFEIDPRPFEAALGQAEGKLAQDQAMVVKTQQDVERYRPLAKSQSLSQEELDNAIQANLGAQASVKSDQAAVDLAKVNVGFTRIISPIDGLAGLASAQIGDLVGLSSPALTTVSTMDPMRVYFQVNEQSYLKFWRQFIESNSVPIEPPPLQMILIDGTVYPHAGKFFFADRQVNINTGTLQIAGLFPNPDYLLRPGQYARVRAQTGIRRDAFVIPQRAVNQLQGTFQVAVVDGQNLAHYKNVKVGDHLGSDWIVESGLASGDRIIVEGLLKAKEGGAVNPSPFSPAAAPSDNHVSQQASNK